MSMLLRLIWRKKIPTLHVIIVIKKVTIENLTPSFQKLVLILATIMQVIDGDEEIVKVLYIYYLIQVH